MSGSVRLADWSITIGTLPRGRTNSVLDVPGVGLEWDEKAIDAHLADNF